MAAQGDSFYRIVTQAVADMATHGFDSEQRLQTWVARIRAAALRSLLPPGDMQRLLNEAFERAYERSIKPGALRKTQPGMPVYGIERLKPKMRAELDRRIMASAQLIRLNREQAIEKTLQRFSGWATSVPVGGTKNTDKRDESAHVRKAMAQLPFEERRVIIDQTHKLSASINEVIAKETGAIAAVWHSHWRQPGYNYREDHRERDLHIYLLKDNWAQKKGFVKVGPDGYFDDHERPGELPFCRCFVSYLHNLTDLPDSMLTVKGRDALADTRKSLGMIA